MFFFTFRFQFVIAYSVLSWLSYYFSVVAFNVVLFMIFKISH